MQGPFPLALLLKGCDKLAGVASQLGWDATSGTVKVRLDNAVVLRALSRREMITALMIRGPLTAVRCPWGIVARVVRA